MQKCTHNCKKFMFSGPLFCRSPSSTNCTFCVCPHIFCKLHENCNWRWGLSVFTGFSGSRHSSCKRGGSESFLSLGGYTNAICYIMPSFVKCTKFNKCTKTAQFAKCAKSKMLTFLYILTENFLHFCNVWTPCLLYLFTLFKPGPALPAISYRGRNTHKKRGYVGHGFSGHWFDTPYDVTILPRHHTTLSPLTLKGRMELGYFRFLGTPTTGGWARREKIEELAEPPPHRWLQKASRRFLAGSPFLFISPWQSTSKNSSSRASLCK